jgi:hypothetical protein
MLAQPSLEQVERLRLDAAPARLPPFFRVNQAAPLEHRQVL